MRRFIMYRKVDISQTHDSNQVNPPDEPQFEGVVFSDGKCAIRWLTNKRSVSVWDCFDDMMAIHGHPEYGSILVWLDEILTIKYPHASSGLVLALLFSEAIPIGNDAEDTVKEDE